MKFPLQFAIILVSFAAISGCGACRDDLAQTIASPSGRLKAVVFNRNCGATTGFNTQVSIVPAANELPNDPGNVLILDGTIPLRVHWQSDSALELSGVGSARIFKQSKLEGGVLVSYKN